MNLRFTYDSEYALIRGAGGYDLNEAKSSFLHR